MKPALSAAHLPEVKVEEFADPMRVDSARDLIRQQAVQLPPRALQARRVIVRLGCSAVIFHASDSRLRTRTSPAAGLAGFVVFGARARGSVNGVAVGGDRLLAMPPGRVASFVTEPGWSSIAFLLPARTLRAHLRARGRLRESGLPASVTMLQIERVQARRLFLLGRRVMRAAEVDPALFAAQAAVRRAAEIEIVETLLAALPAAVALPQTRRERMRREQERMVQRAEAVALSLQDGRLTVTDLCRAVGASERALEYAFQAVVELPPMAYLKRLRLHGVRQALLESGADPTTVSRVALNWGFWHLGDFSRAYKACFGELPSATLRAARTGAGQE